ncbi:MAG TPA: hypothetical protein VNJ04_07120, partial [Gemmatimonadaceae bacterium]|nr:hypothetical protein [Gemmatimonadaceae bacterium]
MVRLLPVRLQVVSGSDKFTHLPRGRAALDAIKGKGGRKGYFPRKSGAILIDTGTRSLEYRVCDHLAAEHRLKVAALPWQ